MNFNQMTRRDLWSFLFLAITTPLIAMKMWRTWESPKVFHPVIRHSKHPYKVFVDPSKPGRVGYTGSNLYDVGYVYAPYIPLKVIG